ncbi:MAG: YwiC-like family protein [Nocardioides sp.]|nr:YwiC-like family protein [Nocardioides sp.]
MATSVARSRPAKRRSPGWVPNQHGAWAMLSAPLLVGIIAGGPAWVHLPLTAFWFAGYFAFFATSLWLKARRRPRYWPPVRAYGIASAVLGLVVAVMEPRLLVWALAFVLPLGVGLAAAAARHERDLLAGLTTVVGSCLMTVVAYDAGTGHVDRRAWGLAVVLALYFLGTVFYVKSAIRERDNPRFLALSVGFHLAAAVTVAWLAWPLGVLFVLLTLRAALLPRRGLTPKQLGIGEIFSTLAVALLTLAVV